MTPNDYPRISVRMSEDLIDLLKHDANIRSLTLSSWIKILLWKHYLNK